MCTASMHPSSLPLQTNEVHHNADLNDAHGDSACRWQREAESPAEGAGGSSQLPLSSDGLQLTRVPQEGVDTDMSTAQQEAQQGEAQQVKHAAIVPQPLCIVIKHGKSVSTCFLLQPCCIKKGGLLLSHLDGE